MTEADDPFWSKWLELSDRRRFQGFASLNDTEQTFFAMNLVKGSADRGGFHPYFDLASREEIDAAESGFRAHGATEIANLLRAARDLLFPTGMPGDFCDQSATLPSWTDEEVEQGIDPPWAIALEELNHRFYSQSQTAYDVVERFFLEHIA